MAINWRTRIPSRFCNQLRSSRRRRATAYHCCAVFPLWVTTLMTTGVLVIFLSCAGDEMVIAIAVATATTATKMGAFSKCDLLERAGRLNGEPGDPRCRFVEV